MIVVVFSVFVTGLCLMGALWCIYSHTGTSMQTLMQNDKLFYTQMLINTKHACWLSGRPEVRQRGGVIEDSGLRNPPPVLMELTSAFHEVN